MDSSPPLAGIALSLMVQDWSVLGLGDDPSVAASSDVDVVVERVTALLLVRIVAVQSPLGTFSDLSTATICRTVMMKSQKWPESITPEIIEQLRDYVKKMLEGYKDVPYHNFEHANHVIVSINKLLDLVLTAGNGNKHQRPPPSFGLRHDPLNQLALVFAAMVHDVEHQGIPNRQLAIEDDRLAILYNDQSIAENWSLYIAFSELLQDEYKSLREVMCGGGPGGYTYFRKTVVNLVLNTDIASPERTQISKSKWKEAFGDPYETVERKVRHEARRMSLTGQDVQIRMDRRASATSRRGTHFSEVSNEDFTDDGSLSGTPDGSVNDEEPYEVTAVASKDSSELLTTQSMHVYSNSPAAGADMGTSAHPPTTRFGRRFSTSSRATTASKYKQRLGILRTVDLSGETLETYSRASMGQASAVSSDKANTVNIDMDEPDELKMTVVMETLMTAADVAHNLQGWDHMVKWSGRLYMELRSAYQTERGADPQHRWFENQIGFLESYLLPLAHKLEDTGVFGDDVGTVFARIVESNRDRWLTEGYDETQTVIGDGAKRYPIEES